MLEKCNEFFSCVLPTQIKSAVRGQCFREIKINDMEQYTLIHDLGNDRVGDEQIRDNRFFYDETLLIAIDKSIPRDICLESILHKTFQYFRKYRH